MAATKVEKNAALAALTSAALSLPGLQAVAAVPAANINANVSYGHYEENNNRMKVDVYHADAVIPLTDRIELSFSLDRDTYTGATPAFSLPVTLTNLPKNDYASGKLIFTDLVSAASGGVTAGGLTALGGLNNFTQYSTLTQAYNALRDTQYVSGIASTKLDLENSKIDLSNSLSQNKIDLTEQYVGDLNDIHPALPDLFNNYVTAEIEITRERDRQLASFSSAPDSITEDKTVDFGFKPSRNEPQTVFGNAGAFYGKANTFDNTSATSCTGGDCIVQNGVVIGTIFDPTGPDAHLHAAGSNSDGELAYHNDSGGIYIRMFDLKAFSFDSLDISTTGQGSRVYEILGFNTALNPNLYNGDGTNYATRVAYQTIADNFNGTLNLNDSFKNVKSVWIHYQGAPNTASTTGLSFQIAIDNLKFSRTPDYLAWQNDFESYKNAINTQYIDRKAALDAQYESAINNLNLTDEQTLALSTANSKKTENLAKLNSQYNADLARLEQDYQNSLNELEQFKNEYTKQSIIASYRSLVDSMVPNGTPAVQRFQWQPMETRSMPQFTARYYFDATTLAVSGGLSDEPDFLSNFGSINVSHEFNDKLTTVSAGYGLTSNTIMRDSGGHSSGSHHSDDDAHNPANYPDLNDESFFHSLNASIAQVLTKNTLFQSSVNYTNQSGYLSNPYKFVYVRGEVTPEEYYQLSLANTPGAVDWSTITNLEMVGLELFRENRPRQRNLWSFSNQLNQHIPELDASVHFDYRFYTDDWNINSHTFELKWFQSLPGGFTVTPSLRYYSQSEAEFFAPYFLAPRADGYYSSDFRLSAFGNLTPGITITKEFARGITLETGFEYTFHSGGLKLGGGGVGDYADFEYFMAHANLNIDFAARPFSMGGGAGDHHMHHHHHHGAPIPAGVMFGHMMSQADEIMVGYRYQYGVQSGSMLHGSDQISDALLVSNACAVSDGCLYKPTKMHMQMHMLDLMYSPTDWLTLMIMPQLMSMDMTMSDSLQPNNEGEHGGSKHTSNDIGDTLAVAMVKLMDDGTHHVHAGIGMSAPTGAIDAEISQGRLKDNGASTERETGTAVLQDYGMQLGSGTWDFKPSLTYTGHIDDWGWGGQLNGTKRLQKNEYGYAYGDIFQATGWGSYNIFNWLSATIRGVYTWQDRIRGETNQTHETTSPVDFPANYGGRFWDVGFGLNASIPEGRFAGNNFSVEWLQPVATDFNGYQLDRDGALTATWSFSF